MAIIMGPSTSCTGVCLAITMLQYYICVGIVLTVVLVLGLGLGFGIILYFVNGHYGRAGIPVPGVKTWLTKK